MLGFPLNLPENDFGSLRYNFFLCILICFLEDAVIFELYDFLKTPLVYSNRNYLLEEKSGTSSLPKKVNQ